VEAGRFIGELAGRKVGEFPELASPAIGSALLRAIAGRGDQMIVVMEMFHEPQRLVAGHCRSNRAALVSAIGGSRDIGPPSTTSCLL
jgi:hypothetical protein